MARVLRVVLGVFAAVVLIAFSSTGDCSHARRFSQEIEAIRAIRTIHTEQVQYFSQYGRYATSLAELGEPASGLRNGYRFTMTGNVSGYAIDAVPESFGKTGIRTFHSDQTMTIRQNYGPEPATINSREIK